MPHTLLYVDDRASELAARKMAFEMSGYTVLVANEGFGALKLVQERTADVVIVSYRREGMDGGVIANAIRKVRPKLPILMLCDLPTELSGSVVRLVSAIVSEREPLEILLSIIAQLIDAKSHKRGYAS